MRIARGLAALVILAGLLVGIPAALVAFGGNPLPGTWSWQALGQSLLRPASDRALIGVVTILGWVAWAGFAASVIAEILNTLSGRPILSGRRIHLQLPGLGFGQKVASVLVVAVVTMIAVPHLQPTAAAAPRTPAPVATAPAAPGPTPTATSTTQPRASTPAATTAKPAPKPSAHHDQQTRKQEGAVPRQHIHVVERGDWLWTLADRYLGDGARWRDIAAANPGIDPNRLAIGQELNIPIPAGRTHSNHARTGHQGGGERTVKPHDGDTITVDDGDSLSAISDDLYGTPRHWPDLYRENRDQITDPNLIDVGQKLDLPDRKHLADTDHRIHHPHTASQPEPRAGHAPPRDTPAPNGRTAEHRPDPTKPPAPPQQARPSTPPGPAQPVPGDAARTETAENGRNSAPSPAADAAPTEDHQAAVEASPAAAVSVGLLLAAGLITTINLRRRRQLRARRPGRRIPAPSPAAAQIEEAVKAHGEPLRVDQLDQVTRAIAAHCHHTGTELPALSAVRVADHRIDFLFTRPANNPPPGMDVAAEGSVWTLHVDNLPSVLQIDGIDDATPPYPALVTLGRDADTAHVLIDLEAAAALTVAADTTETAAAMLASIALELAVSPWAGDLTLTFAGPLLPDLVDGLDHPAVTHVDDIDEVLTALEARAAQQRTYLDDATVGQKRVDPELADAWCPHVVLFGHELNHDQAERLAQIVTDLPRVAIAAVTTNPDLSPWRFQLDNTGTGHLSPHDWQLTPQLVTPDQYRHVLELIGTSGTDDTTPAPWWNHDARTEDAGHEATVTALPAPQPAVDDAEPLGELDPADDGQKQVATAGGLRTAGRTPLTLHALIGPDDRADTPPARLPRRPATRPAADRLDLSKLAPPTPDYPMLRILGEPDLVGAQGAPFRRYKQRAMEFMLYILEHPGTTSTRLRNTFCFSRDYTKNVTGSLRKTVGADPDGNPYLPELGKQPGYRFHDQVTSDWIYANRLIGRGVNVAPTEALIRVLSMVRGRPLEGAEDWIDTQTLRTDIESTLCDTAHELVDRALHDDDLTLARWAASRGLIAAPDSEILLTDQLRTEKQAGNQADVDRLAGRISANARALGVDLLDETREVLRDAAM